MQHSFEITGNIVDIFNKRIFYGTLTVMEDKISKITEISTVDNIHTGPYMMPGFIDSHIHIESSMLTPYEFSRKALLHGTVATISDPHEIANVCGVAGVHYMLENARNAKLKIHFGAPSCVPATQFETSGATLSPKDVQKLLMRDDIFYLSEMMNYPGVLHSDKEVMEKIALAKEFNKPIDGHAPGLNGDEALQYINAGITTDHECFTYNEALFKIQHGMKILIREGSAARNFDALHPLISEYPDLVMLCSDDKHPDELMLGHINLLAKRAIESGHNLFDVLKCACVNPVLHYKMKVGLLRENDVADFIVVEDLIDFKLLESYINGEQVVLNGHCVLEQKPQPLINHFNAHFKTAIEFAIPAIGGKINIIEALDGQLITKKLIGDVKAINGAVVSDIENDILKMVVVNRYSDTKPAVAFIKNFDLKYGAIASTVAHDSHNIIAVGVDDESIAKAVNLLVENKGGLSVITENDSLVLPLPVAGLMSDLSCDEVGALYAALDKKVKEMGCGLRAPFMTLSFMALLVIPNLKLSDKGLFDGENFCFTDVILH
jgi:adenine deaminase